MGFSVVGHMQQTATKITTPTIENAKISRIRLASPLVCDGNLRMRCGMHFEYYEK